MEVIMTSKVNHDERQAFLALIFYYYYYIINNTLIRIILIDIISIMKLNYKQISGRVNRVTATETVNLGLIPRLG